jgi:hypothetical protein
MLQKACASFSRSLIMAVAVLVEALNFLNHPFFAVGITSVTTNSFGQISSSSRNRSVLFRAYVSW